MRVHKEPDQAGFTLLEAIVATAIFVIIVGIAFASMNHLMTATRASDNIMLVNSENQRGIRELKNDLLSSTKNYNRLGVPVYPVDGELRFAVAVGFNNQTAKTIFSLDLAPDNPTPFLVCYWLNQGRNMLCRRFRDPTTFDLIPKSDLYNSPAWSALYGGSPAVVSTYCTDFQAPVTPLAILVNVTLKNELGNPGSKDYASCERMFSIRPYNSKDD